MQHLNMICLIPKPSYYLYGFWPHSLPSQFNETIPILEQPLIVSLPPSDNRR